MLLKSIAFFFIVDILYLSWPEIKRLGTWPWQPRPLLPQHNRGVDNKEGCLVVVVEVEALVVCVFAFVLEKLAKAQKPS